MLSYPFGEQRPEPGAALELAPGVRWLRMPLPFALDHVNLWLLRDRLAGRDGWAIVDCGIADAATRSAWEQLFASGLDGLPVLRVLVTHLHPDHAGFADWLVRRWRDGPGGCGFHMSTPDWRTARGYLDSGSGVGGEAAARFFARHGLTDHTSLSQVRARASYYVDMVPALPQSFVPLDDGQVLEIGGSAWHCIAGYGHAPEHIALHSPALGVLISGDMVLPRITTNVSVLHGEAQANPLPRYLASIARLRALPPDTLVLPSHGLPFVGLHERIDALEAHHDARLAEVLAACTAAPRSAADLLGVLFRRRLDLHQTTFAMGEAVAHLRLLACRGDLTEQVDADGVVRFARAG